MTSKSPLIYWDTCIFLTLLNEDRKNPEFHFIKMIHEDAQKGKIIIVTSCITLTEAYFLRDGKENKKNIRTIRNFFSNTYIRLVEVTRPIAEQTQEFRQKYHKQVDFEDAIHLTTSIDRDISTFLTVDGNRQPENKLGKVRRNLLLLDKNLHTKSNSVLRIIKPSELASTDMPLLAELENKIASAEPSASSLRTKSGPHPPNPLPHLQDETLAL